MAYQKLILHYKILYEILKVNTKSYSTNRFCTFLSINTNYTFCTNSTKQHNSQTNLDALKENIDINEIKRLNFSGTKYITQTLQKILNLTPTEAKMMVKENPRFKKCSPEQIENNYKLYHNEGITSDMLKHFPMILTLQDSKFRLELLKQLSVDVNNTAPILLTNINILKRMVNDAIAEQDTVPYGNRITHLSKTLNVPEWEISEKMLKHSYILRLPLGRLEKVLKVLLDYGVEPKNIMSDFWSLRYSPELVEKRLQSAIKANVQKVKTWMIRCPDRVFERCINRQIENRKILGSDSSVEDYLSKRLECSKANARYLTEKYPALEKMNISKMKEIMDFLFKQGYTPGHICRVPRILIHSLETTNIRLAQLRQMGYIPPSLAVLCKSKRDYDKYIKKYRKKKLQSETEES